MVTILWVVNALFPTVKLILPKLITGGKLGGKILENADCIFCKIPSDDIVIEDNGFKGRKCPECNLTYLSPRPSYPEILDLYIHDRACVSSESHICNHFEKRLIARHNLAIIKKYISSGDLLEVGPGAGYFLNEARGEGFNTYSIELNSILVDFINNGLGIPCEGFPINEHSFGRMKFDIIYHSNVASHLYDPISEFKKMNRKLRNDGLLVFETGSLSNIKEEYYKAFSGFQYPDHLYFFTEKNLKDLLEITGYEFIKIYRYSILPKLVMAKTLRRVLDSIKRRNTNGNSKSNDKNGVSYNNNGKNRKRLNKSVYQHIIYLLHYKIGYLTIKKRRPQSVIIIARKK
jgi:SAM-dependent methyltransferase